MSDYKMSCYRNMEAILADNGLRFFDASTVPSFPAERVFRGGELGSVDRELVMWRETAVDGVVEVIDAMSGRVYNLLGDITTAEEFALTVALAHVKSYS